ncbi:MAG TPA: PIG-L family deacetylase, partial [Herpetosiphonaceae bacterium]|nr:PIG-L family deacetylase [Herpetosiphonaceae bacterium]
MSDTAPSLLVFGAHPDDCEYTAGGLAALYARQGRRVCFVSVTNGDAGHQTLAGAQLARIRREEARAAAEALGIESLVLDNHDGELLPTLDRRREIIRIIREFKPDLILTPRPNDYHPDHRYTSILVQDAAYMVTVPNVVAHAEHLRINPLIMYVIDHFQKPYPFTPDVVVDVEPVIEQKFEAIHRHTSQMYEWLPYNARRLEEVPEGS